MEVESKNWSQHHQVVVTFLERMDEEMVMSVVESQVTSTAVAGLKSDF